MQLCLTSEKFFERHTYNFKPTIFVLFNTTINNETLFHLYQNGALSLFKICLHSHIK